MAKRLVMGCRPLFFEDYAYLTACNGPSSGLAVTQVLWPIDFQGGRNGASARPRDSCKERGARRIPRPDRPSRSGSRQSPGAQPQEWPCRRTGTGLRDAIPSQNR